MYFINLSYILRRRFCRRLLILPFVFVTLSLFAANDRGIQLEAAVSDALGSTNLTSESAELFDWQSIPCAQTCIVRVTTEVLYKEGTNVEYYYHEATRSGLTNEIFPVSIPKKVKIVNEKEEIPKVKQPEKKQEIAIKLKPKKKKPELISYIDYVEIDGEDFPDYNAPVLSDKIGIADPIEGFNRVMFIIDGSLYTYFVGPIGKGYRYITPVYLRKGFSRMDYNIQFPKHLINNLLQAKFKGAGVSATRFLINSTVGILGFYDPAKEWFDLEKYDADLGQTLAKWGVGDGCYVYLPIISSIGDSTTPRDIFSAFIDDQMDPRAWIPFGGSSIRFLMKFNNMTLNLDTIDRLQKENFDPYVLRRDIGHLIRQSEIMELNNDDSN